MSGTDIDADPTPRRATAAQIFLLVTVGGSLVAIDIGYDFGAFGTINYRRIFPIFVISTVALIASFVTDGPEVTDAKRTRAILALPALYLLADMVQVTDAEPVYIGFVIVIVATLPFTLYIVARMANLDFFQLNRRLQFIAAVTLVAMLLAGLYVGANHPRFFECADFELAGDYVPENCTVQD
ncbi:MAG: hypothetical protein AAGC53_10750 [Actinomycetota bacterium]